MTEGAGCVAGGAMAVVGRCLTTTVTDGVVLGVNDAPPPPTHTPHQPSQVVCVGVGEGGGNLGHVPTQLLL
jgi:hypothetical protein